MLGIMKLVVEFLFDEYFPALEWTRDLSIFFFLTPGFFLIEGV